MEKKESILQLFPDTYRSFFKEVIKQSEQINEIRMRAERPIIVIWSGQEYFLTAGGAFTKEEKLAEKIGQKELEMILNHICNYSIYAFEDEIRQGFLTVQGGHRIGVAGQAVMKFAVKAMAYASELVLEKAGLTMDDIALVVPHQANYRIVDSAIKRMGIGEDKVFLNLSKYGNTSGSCIPVALSQAVEQGRAKKGDKLILVGFGGGLTWGALIVQL